MTMTVSLDGVYFALMHYSMLSWFKKNNGSIYLYRHVHARMDDKKRTGKGERNMIAQLTEEEAKKIL